MISKPAPFRKNGEIQPDRNDDGESIVRSLSNELVDVLIDNNIG